MKSSRIVRPRQLATSTQDFTSLSSDATSNIQVLPSVQFGWTPQSPKKQTSFTIANESLKQNPYSPKTQTSFTMTHDATLQKPDAFSPKRQTSFSIADESAQKQFQSQSSLHPRMNTESITGGASVTKSQGVDAVSEPSGESFRTRATSQGQVVRYAHSETQGAKFVMKTKSLFVPNAASSNGDTDYVVSSFGDQEINKDMHLDPHYDFYEEPSQNVTSKSIAWGNVMDGSRGLLQLFPQKQADQQSTQLSMEPFFLTFDDPFAEQEFRTRLAKNMSKPLRKTAILACIITFLFSISNAFVGKYASMSITAIGTVSLMGSAFYTTKFSRSFESFRKIWIITSLTCFLCATLTFTVDKYSSLNVYSVLTVLVLSVLIRREFKFMFKTVICFLAVYTGSAIYIASGVVLIRICLHFAIFCGIFLLTTYFSEKSERLQFIFEKRTAEYQDRLSQQRKKTVDILYSIHPRKIADYLLDGSTNSSLFFTSKKATLMMIDYAIGPRCISFSPVAVGQSVDRIVTLIDGACQKYGIEKIKTNGYHYMAVAGLLDFSLEAELRVCRAALEIHRQLTLTQEFIAYSDVNGGARVRITIMTGSMYGGIIDAGKRTFDVFGPLVTDAKECLHQMSSSDILINKQCLDVVHGVFETKSHPTQRNLFILGNENGKADSDYINTRHPSDATSTVFSISSSNSEEEQRVREIRTKTYILSEEHTRIFRPNPTDMDVYLERRDRGRIALVHLFGVCLNLVICGLIQAYIVFLQYDVDFMGKTLFFILRFAIFTPGIIALYIGYTLSVDAPANSSPWRMNPHKCSFCIIWTYWAMVFVQTLVLHSQGVLKLMWISMDYSFAMDYMMHENFSTIVLLASSPMIRHRIFRFVAVIWCISSIGIYIRTGINAWDVLSLITAGRNVINTILVPLAMLYICSRKKDRILRDEMQTRYIQHQKIRKVQTEQQLIDSLILSFMPESVYNSLVHQLTVGIEFYRYVSVLMIDIDFPLPFELSISPEEKLRFMSAIFSKLEEEAKPRQLELIKTMNTSAVVVAGLHPNDTKHEERICEFAVTMMHTINSLAVSEEGCHLRLKAGIDCGRCVVGVAGRLRFSYDIWGEPSKLTNHSLLMLMSCSPITQFI
eukprot:TRINITY_DN6142_c0_g4_i4.p1 TRINITY_DN6142_c0_g4~~TRINITY_DN6142_c0_g4_i4.p1  ORF type:complete len:1123 (+),score=177.96 TRINITY_DN6142_c0_g4_i4:600-3968(+)